MARALRYLTHPLPTAEYEPQRTRMSLQELARNTSVHFAEDAAQVGLVTGNTWLVEPTYRVHPNEAERFWEALLEEPPTPDTVIPRFQQADGADVVLRPPVPLLMPNWRNEIDEQLFLVRQVGTGSRPVQLKGRSDADRRLIVADAVQTGRYQLLDRKGRPIVIVPAVTPTGHRRQLLA